MVQDLLVDEFEFAPLRSKDVRLLATWLARPHVATWWKEATDPVAVAQRYSPVAEGLDPTEAFIVHFNGRPIGYIQRYLINEDPDWRVTIRTALADVDGIGIDYLIGEPDLVGKGVGRRMISRFIQLCWERYPLEHHVTVAVQQGNIASWRALEASGFRRAWSGNLDSPDPSDRGPSFIYVLTRSD